MSEQRDAKQHSSDQTVIEATTPDTPFLPPHLSNQTVVPGESELHLQLVINNFVQEFNPKSTFEMAMIRNLAIAMWRQWRLQGTNNAGVVHEIHKQETNPDNGDILTLDAATRAHIAMRDMYDRTRSVNTMHRQENTYEIQLFRAVRGLAWFRRQR